MELGKFSTADLVEELKRRENLGDKPQQIENPNLTKLRKVTSEYIDSIYDGTYHIDSDISNYIYKAAMEALYKEGIFDWINNNTP